MSKELFGRKVEFLHGRFKLTNEFKVNFDVPFDDGPDVNIAEVEFYNLSDQTINNIKRGAYSVLNAGYTGDVGAILTGKVKHIETEWMGVNKITTIFIADSNDEWMEKDIQRTYKEKIKAKQILTDLLAQSGLKVGALELPVNKVYESGKTVEGKISKAIFEIAQDCGAKMHINKGQIFIRKKTTGDNIGFVLDKEHGLVGSPTRIEKEETMPDGSKKIKQGYKVVSLLNHRISTDSLIRINSKTAKGLYRVEKGNHYCGGSSFYTEMEVYPA